jgi:hypothetical protein
MTMPRSMAQSAVTTPAARKRCASCAEHHDVTAFLPSRFTPDGWTSNCLASIRRQAAADRAAREARQQKAAREALAAPKRCRSCGVVRKLDAFAKHHLAHDGHRRDCRSCVATGKVKSRSTTPAESARRKELAAKPEQRVRNRLTVERWSEANPEAKLARRKLAKAIREGKIVPAKVCQISGCSNPKVEAHHHDYARPLEVLWLCRGCHSRRHHGARLTLRKGVSRRLARLPK